MYTVQRGREEGGRYREERRYGGVLYILNEEKSK